MKKIQHKFSDHQIDPKTEILIIGTFNPDSENNKANFFYSRKRNMLWEILPFAFGENNLKGHSKEEKLEFIKKHRIDFIDLIEEIEVESGKEDDYSDKYIDGKVTRWRNVIDVIDNLPKLKKVCISRKTFSDVPNIKIHVENIQQHCNNSQIFFKALSTPARFKNELKQSEWTSFLLYDHR